MGDDFHEVVAGLKLELLLNVQARGLFEQHGVLIQEWDRVRTDWLTIRDGASRMLAPAS